MRDITLVQARPGAGCAPGLISEGYPTSSEEAALDFESERREADALFLAFGSVAIQRASDYADDAELAGDGERATYWRRITALIAALSPTGLKS